jgi:hypothetical protein
MIGLGVASPADRLKPPDKTKPEVPDLLPHLCDRVRQERLLVESVREWKKNRIKRPFICIIHGDDDECHEMFQRRLKEVTLPRLLRNRLEGEATESAQSQGELISVDDFFIPLPNSYFPVKRPFEFLRSDLGRAIADDIDASAQVISGAISQYKKPLMFYSYLSSLDWEPDGRKLIEAYLQFWSALPDVSSNTPIVCCLFLKYSVTDKEERKTAAKQYIETLSDTLATHKKLRGVVLEELPPIGFSDVQNWINDTQYFRQLCRLHPRAFCNIAQAAASITNIFNSPEAQALGGKLPMQLIAPKLIKVINDNRC